jgi:hypothetical protein
MGTGTIAATGEEARMTDSTDSTGSPEDARIAAARERVLADARRARRVGDQVAVRFDPRRGERDPTFDLDALGVQYTVTLHMPRRVPAGPGMPAAADRR